MHSNGQQRTEKEGYTEKGCHKPALQQNTTDDMNFHFNLCIKVLNTQIKMKVQVR